MIGQRFGNLVVIEQIQNSNDSHKRYKCRCDCGNDCIVYATHLRNNKRTCCAKCSLKGINKKHGLWKKRIYRIWTGIKDRCLNKNGKDYKNYGGRGIKICTIWEKDVEEFAKWAFENGYRDDLTIDRIDVNGDYCSENCRWVTKEEQAKNKRNNVFVVYNNKKMIASDCAKIVGISEEAMIQRVHRHNGDERIFEKQWRDDKWHNQYTIMK